MKRLISLLSILVLGLSITFFLDKLYCQYENTRNDRELVIFAERFQRVILHSLTDLTAVGDLRAFFLARDTYPTEEEFIRYAAEVKKYYRTVSLFAYTGENGQPKYIYPKTIDKDSLNFAGREQAIAKAIDNKKTVLTSPLHINGGLAVVAVDLLQKENKYQGIGEVYFAIDIILEQAFASVSVEDHLFFVRIADTAGNVFWEKGSIPDGKNRLFREVLIPVGDVYWQATFGWQQFPQPNGFIRAFMWAGGGLVTLLLMIIVNGVWAKQAWLTRQVAEKTTELIAKNQTLLEAKEAQDRAERLSSLGTMAAGISHEINQPLNSIKILSSGILYSIQADEYLPTAEVGRVVQEISSQADRISNIITHMRSIIRHDDRIEVPGEINKAVKQALDIIGTQITNHGIKVEIELADDLPLVPVSPTALEEIVVNLVVNAMQALDKMERVEKRITICTRLSGGVILEVSDNGPGIEEENLGKIYDPFFSTKDSCENLGFGLPIVHSIIVACEGNIDVISGENGTTFQISFPIIKPRGEDYEHINC